MLGLRRRIWRSLARVVGARILRSMCDVGFTETHAALSSLSDRAFRPVSYTMDFPHVMGELPVMSTTRMGPQHSKNTEGWNVVRRTTAIPGLIGQ